MKNRIKNSLGTLLAAITLIISQPVSGQLCYTFDDNQVPDGWTLETRRSGSLSNGRLEARPIDGWLRLSTPITETLQMVTLEFEGRVEDSFWGSSLSVTAWLAGGERFGIGYANEGFEFGNDNHAIIGYSQHPGGYLDVFRHPEEFVNYRFMLELTDGLIHFVVRRSADLSLVSDQWVLHPDMVLANLVDLSVQVGFNTGSGVTWMDDLCVTLTPSVIDSDGDGVPDEEDNCPDTANADQLDTDGDGIGDICDADIDGDGIPNGSDNCVFAANADQSDFDQDGEGDACDSDVDGDGVTNENDLCPFSNTRPTIVIGGCDSGVGNILNIDGQGCSLSDLLAECTNAKNHGKYVSCVAEILNVLMQEGLISGRDKGQIMRCAARADLP